MRNKQNWQQGFLMIDALLAIVIITTALVAIIGMFVQSTKATYSSTGYTIASHLAQQQIESLKQQENIKKPGVDTIKTVAATYHTIDTDANIELPTGFSMISTATQHPDFPNELAQITVTISWTDQTKAHKVPFTTFFSTK